MTNFGGWGVLQLISETHLAYECKKWNESTQPQKGIASPYNLLCTLLLPYRGIQSVGACILEPPLGWNCNSLHFCPILPTEAHSISHFAQHITTTAVMVHLWSFLYKAALPSLLRCTRLAHGGRIQRPVMLPPPLVRACSSIQLLWRWGRKPPEGEKVCLFSSTHAQRRGRMLLFPLPIGCEHIPSLSAQSA